MNLLTHLEHRCGKRESRPVQRHGKTKLLIRNTLCHVELKWWIRLGRILQHARQLRAEDARLEWSEDALLTGASSGASHNVTERIFIEVDVRWGTTGSRSAGELKLLRSVAAILKYQRGEVVVAGAHVEAAPVHVVQRIISDAIVAPAVVASFCCDSHV